MIFEGGFELQATPDEVMQKFSDIESVARCIPGLEMTGQDADGNYLGTMSVAFGPKMLKFGGKVNCEFDHVNHSGNIVGGGINGSKSASVKARTQFSVVPVGSASDGEPRSRVEIQSHIELGGVIESFANTGGIALGKQIMKQFAQNLARQIEESGQAVAENTGTQEKIQQQAPAPVQSLNIFSLLWHTLVAMFRPSQVDSQKTK
ncbi:SRPBCC family protein [Alcaligenaceae bacterium]|nr:SRPBCC family protein [Alcaligenaceae bacterium]